MGERRPCKAEVVGSSPICSTSPRRPSRHLGRCGEVLRDLEMVFDNSNGFSKAEHASVSGLCVVKLLRVNGGCLGAERRRRTQQAAKSPGEPQAGCDPGMSEWGNPAGVMPSHLLAEYIGLEEPTRGSEPSQYPEEEKATAIPLVAASERGSA